MTTDLLFIIFSVWGVFSAINNNMRSNCIRKLFNIVQSQEYRIRELEDRIGNGNSIFSEPKIDESWPY